jgi:hypothetical protein
MLELVRTSSLSHYQMTSASKGALHVPPAEMLEILVYIAEHNRIFGDQARMTLAAWDEASAKVIAMNRSTAPEILDYWLSAKNIRPALLPLLLENPSAHVSKISELAATVKGELADVMIASPRVRASRQLLNDLAGNVNLSGAQTARVRALLELEAAPAKEAEPGVKAPEAVSEPMQPQIEHEPGEVASLAAATITGEEEVEASAADPETELALAAFYKEHEAEIAAGGERPFQPIGGMYDEIATAEEPKAAAAAATASTPAVSPHVHKKVVHPEEEKRGSVLQKIAKLDIKGRIQLAMKGSKEERSILIRDGTKIVALAVLDSPKITDGEVEKFASQKNVLEAVLRAIPMKRRFAKNYAVVRNLIFNPRTPLDVGLGLMKNLLVSDLKNLSGNKEVSETVRKLALRMFKQKSQPGNKD